MELHIGLDISTGEDQTCICKRTTHKNGKQTIRFYYKNRTPKSTWNRVLREFYKQLKDMQKARGI